MCISAASGYLKLMAEPGAADTPLELEILATMANASALRRQFRDWLTTAAPDSASPELVLAVYEALANVVEHAYLDRLDGPGPVRLRVHRSGDELLITVSDDGVWRDPAAQEGYRGRGLPLMRELTTHTQVDHDLGGTTVTLRADARQ